MILHWIFFCILISAQPLEYISRVMYRKVPLVISEKGLIDPTTVIPLVPITQVFQRIKSHYTFEPIVTLSSGMSIKSD
jgi:hypothetical protein